MWWMLAGLALADVDSLDRWLGNDNLVIGIHEDGSLVNPDLEIGIQWDPDGPEGDIPLGGDMIRVGYHWEYWAWSYTSGDTTYGGTNLGPHDDSDMEMSWEGPWLTDTVHGLKATGSEDLLQIDLAMAVSQSADLMWTDFTITALADVEDLWLARGYDPDQDYWATDTYSTDNISGEGYGVATGEYDNRTIALLGISASGLGTGGVCSWCSTPSGVVSGAGWDVVGDYHPGVAVEVGSLAEGESAKVRFVYGFALGESSALGMSFAWLSEDDLDGDGTSADTDCDDWDATVSPDTEEIADGLDNDCDGEIDEDTVASDDDGDGWTELDGDCDDADPLVYPGASAVDGVMNADCDGEADTGWWAEEDTGEPEDTGSQDTGSQDTGSQDTGTQDTGGQGTSEADTGGDTGNTAGEPETDKTENQGCGCSMQASPSSGFGVLGLMLFGIVRRRKENR